MTRYYDAKTDLNPADYPDHGSAPIRLEINAEAVADLFEKSRYEGLSWEDAHKVCYFLATLARDFLEHELSQGDSFVPFSEQSTPLDENKLTGACRDASTLIAIAGSRMGFKTRAFHTDMIGPHQHQHQFSIINLPIRNDKTGEILSEPFLLDPTFRQFFKPNAHETLPGKRLSENFAHRVISDHVLKFGFCHLNRSTGSAYFQAFNAEPVTIKAPKDFKDRLKQLLTQSARPEPMAYTYAAAMPDDVHAMDGRTLSKTMRQILGFKDKKQSRP